jgi:hypothetical protein
VLLAVVFWELVLTLEAPAFLVLAWQELEWQVLVLVFLVLAEVFLVQVQLAEGAVEQKLEQLAVVSLQLA